VGVTEPSSEPEIPNWTGVAPARTAWFYIVNAWLREYVAVLTYRRRPALACAGIAGVFAVLYALLALGAQTGIIG